MLKNPLTCICSNNIASNSAFKKSQRYKKLILSAVSIQYAPVSSSYSMLQLAVSLQYAPVSSSYTDHFCHNMHDTQNFEALGY